MNFIYIWHDGRYRLKFYSEKFLSCDLEVKFKDLEFSYKSQTFCIKVYILVAVCIPRHMKYFEGYVYNFHLSICMIVCRFIHLFVCASLSLNLGQSFCIKVNKTLH